MIVPSTIENVYIWENSIGDFVCLLSSHVCGSANSWTRANNNLTAYAAYAGAVLLRAECICGPGPGYSRLYGLMDLEAAVKYLGYSCLHRLMNSAFRS